MIQGILKLVLSIMVTSWVYAELTILFPRFEDFSEQIFAIARFPTHDEWPEIANSPTATKLDDDLSQLIQNIEISEKNITGFLFDESVKEVWKTGNIANLVNGKKQKPEVKKKSIYLSGEDIFISSKKKAPDKN